MSTTAAFIAINSANTAIAAQAAQQAAEAKAVACRTSVRGYVGDTATVPEARQYAECVQLLFPAPASATDVVMIKAAIIIALIGMVIGGVKGWQEERGILMPALMAFMGSVSAVLVATGVSLVAVGVYFLFS